MKPNVSICPTSIIGHDGSKYKLKKARIIIVANETRTLNQQNNNSKSVEAAESFLMELKKRAMDAHAANDVFMMSLMTELIKVTSPIVTRAINRYHREERARINSMHKDLRAKSRGNAPFPPQS